MNDLTTKIKEAIEASSQQGRTLGLAEAIRLDLEQAGQRNRANDLSSQIEASLKRASGNDAPPIPAPATIAKPDGVVPGNVLP